MAINPDGKFSITSGGITHGIKRELGLSDQECQILKQNSVWDKIINEFEGETNGQKNMIVTNNQNSTPTKSNNYLVHANAVIEFSKDCWQRIVKLVNDTLHKNIETEETDKEDNVQVQPKTNAQTSSKITPLQKTPTTSEVEPPAELEQNVKKARDYLTSQLNNLTKEDLQNMGITEAKRDRILQYLQNITYDKSHDSAQAKGSGIVFSIYCEKTDDLANMITLLMHEANHCDESYLDAHPELSQMGDLRHRKSDGTPKSSDNYDSVNTKEEEKACESLGLLTTAVLIKKGVLKGQDDYGRYGNPHHPVTSYLTNKNLLKSDVETWANAQYSNYPEGINNAGITVEHTKDKKCKLPDSIRNQEPLQLQAGDIIKVGDKSYTLGGDNGIVLSPMDSIPIFQMVPEGNTKNDLLGYITFDKLLPSEQELDFYNEQNGRDGWIKSLIDENKKYITVQIYRNGEIIYTGKKY